MMQATDTVGQRTTQKPAPVDAGQLILIQLCSDNPSRNGYEMVIGILWTASSPEHQLGNHPDEGIVSY